MKGESRRQQLWISLKDREEMSANEQVEQSPIKNGSYNVSVKLPQEPKHQTTRPDAVTRVLVSVFETRVIDVLPLLGFLFLTYNVIEALCKAKDDYRTILFVVSSYTILIALFCCLKSFEKLQVEELRKKTRLKIAIWILATSLNILFSYRVTSVLDSVVMSSSVWTLAIVTTVGSFYGLFLLSEEKNQTSFINQ